MKSTKIIRAFFAAWKLDLVLANITLRSTSIPPNKIAAGTALPYAVITCEHTIHEFSSATYQIADYRVEITAYCGQDRALANAISVAMSDCFDRKLFIFSDCYTLSCLPDYEDPVVDKDTDDRSRDVNVVKQGWMIKLSESQ
jgi:hypothetical protein